MDLGRTKKAGQGGLGVCEGSRRNQVAWGSRTDADEDLPPLFAFGLLYNLLSGLPSSNHHHHLSDLSKWDEDLPSATDTARTSRSPSLG